MNRAVSHVFCLICVFTLCLSAQADVVYVDADAKGQGNGTSWADAFASLTAAIETASVGDEVWVAEGTYGPIVLKSGLKIYGGFAGTEAAASAGDPDRYKTYISGQGKTRAVQSIGNDLATILSGVYITDGFVELPDVGGGVYLEKSDAMFVRCIFTKNKSVAMGGAVAVLGGAPTFVNCRFFGNDGGWGAGAVFSRMSATPTFANCLFHTNKATEAGAVGIVDGEPKFVNCTFAGNEATIGTGGALFDTRGEAVIQNCIIWGNKAAKPGTDEVFNVPASGSKTLATYSAIKGGWTGDGNIAIDPLFVDALNGDYRLKPTSPCRDKGQDASLPKDVADLSADGNTTEVLPKDLGLKARVNGDAVDMGAYEWHP